MRRDDPAILRHVVISFSAYRKHLPDIDSFQRNFMKGTPATQWNKEQ
jgi:hypothetical protein